MCTAQHPAVLYCAYGLKKTNKKLYSELLSPVLHVLPAVHLSRTLFYLLKKKKERRFPVSQCGLSIVKSSAVSAVHAQSGPVVRDHKEVLVHGFTEAGAVQLWGNYCGHFTCGAARAQHGISSKDSGTITV